MGEKEFDKLTKESYDEFWKKFELEMNLTGREMNIVTTYIFILKQKVLEMDYKSCGRVFRLYKEA